MVENDIIYNEVALLQQFREGNDAAFTAIYKLMHQRVFLFARKYLNSTADAQDLTAETFVQLLHQHRSFQNLDGIAAFLHVTVRNKCFNLLKYNQMKLGHHARLLQLLDEKDSGNFLEEQIQVELVRKIYAQVEKLPTRMKEIFLLSYLEGLKPAEIAERLQIKPQTVINQRVTAIKLLQELLPKESLVLLMLALMDSQRPF